MIVAWIHGGPASSLQDEGGLSADGLQHGCLTGRQEMATKFAFALLMWLLMIHHRS